MSRVGAGAVAASGGSSACEITRHAVDAYLSRHPRSLYGNYAKGFEDVAASLSETDAYSGTVKFETEGDRLVKVSVMLEYTPHTKGDPVAEVAHAQAQLERDLDRYRTFLLRRCERETCRPPESKAA